MGNVNGVGNHVGKSLLGGMVVGFVLAVAISLVAVALGGCAATVAPGPTFEQSSDAGVTKLQNQPPGAIGIREEGLNWAATGAANVKAVRVTGDGVLQLGSGPATRQVYWNPKTNAFVLSSETDFRVDAVSVFNAEGKPLYDVKGFSTLASDPTRAMAEPLAAWGKTLEALSQAELETLRVKLTEQGQTVREAVPKVADMLGGMASIVGDVLKAKIAATAPVTVTK